MRWGLPDFLKKARVLKGWDMPLYVMHCAKLHVVLPLKTLQVIDTSRYDTSYYFLSPTAHLAGS